MQLPIIPVSSLGVFKFRFVFLGILLISIFAAARANAQSETVLYSFTGEPDGSNAVAALVMDAQGNLYGTSANGGAPNCGCGIVFKLDTAGNETVLHAFGGPPTDGANPGSRLLLDGSGNLYGTTNNGGANGGGVVFKIETSGNETVLYNFGAYVGDASEPEAGLIFDGSGNLYGTSAAGGTSDFGAVFKIDSIGNESVLHSFTGGENGDGQLPLGALVMDAAGNLYGTTANGGDPICSCGIVFKLDTANKETVLYTFEGGNDGTDGSQPVAGLILDAQGNLYGTTQNGGTSNAGTVFELATSGNETVLYSFKGGSGDGANPRGDLVRDSSGNFYSTTWWGATGTGSCPNGCGTVFELSATGQESVLHSFAGSPSDGELPVAGLVRASSGDLYGTTSGGGTVGGAGTIFEVSFNSAATTTTLASSLNPSTYGQTVTLTATVTSSGSGTPTGTVTFTDGTTTVRVTLVNGVAVQQTSMLQAGSHSITASYGGDSNFAPSPSAPLLQTVNQAPSGLTLSSSNQQSFYEQPITYTATIVPQYGGVATGNVTFTYDSGILIGTSSVSSNSAVITTSTLPIGTHNILASYSGDTNVGASVATFFQSVHKELTTIEATTSANPITTGQSVTFTATVTSITGPPPDGESVSFNNKAGVPYGSGTLSGGVATFTTSSLPIGADVIRVVYYGDARYAGSIVILSETVNKYATTATVASNLNPSSYGQSVTFTATVSASAGETPTGTVTFKNGSAMLGTATLSGGTANFATTTLTVGTHSITAVYGGDATHAGSTSAALSQVVNKAGTMTALASSQNPSTSGQSVTFTATVTSSTTGVPTGAVIFKSGTKALGSATLSGGKASVSTTTLAVGSDTITATYNGSANYAGSSATLTQTVN